MSEKKRTILVCQGTGCVSSKSPEIQESLKARIAQEGLDDQNAVELTGCHGFCQRGPLVVIEPESTCYTGVSVKDVDEIVESHLKGNQPVERLLYKDIETGDPIEKHQNIPFYEKQHKIVLKGCGRINPEKIEDYIRVGGYEGLKKVLSDMTPEQVVEELKTSGLRGRGGGGFPAGRKWEAGLQAEGKEKYVVCNADEGDPGAFMDRSMLEADPHSVIEGMIIAGYTTGASMGYVYVRAEYPLAVKRLKIAIEQARENNYLGKNVLNSGFDFDLGVFQGAGAFVCGESTALTLSMEGRRGMPKASPRPRTTEEGLYDKPTLLNNVKTFAYVPQIITNGGDWFASIGTEKSKGTAVFALTGMVENCGLVEVPMGTTIREIIYDIGGGIPDGKKFKAVQTGGPSGGCLPENFLDTPVDYDSLLASGSMMGSGGMVVMDETTCMVDVARYFLDFTQQESCGQCTLCKLGTKQMLNILEDIVAGKGKPGDIDILLEIGESVNAGSLCGLGQSAANPVLTTIKYFKEEYEAHINDKQCPALACKALISYRINADKCKGCTACSRVCPVGAITGEKKEVHVIDQSKCIQCGMCFEKCPKKFGSVECIPGRLNEGGK